MTITKYPQTYIDVCQKAAEHIAGVVGKYQLLISQANDNDPNLAEYKMIVEQGKTEIRNLNYRINTGREPAN